MLASAGVSNISKSDLLLGTVVERLVAISRDSLDEFQIILSNLAHAVQIREPLAAAFIESAPYNTSFDGGRNDFVDALVQSLLEDSN